MVFVYVPIVWSPWLTSSTRRTPSPPSDFVGFGNYVDMLTDGRFQDSLITFTVFAAFIVPLTFASPWAWR